MAYVPVLLLSALGLFCARHNLRRLSPILPFGLGCRSTRPRHSPWHPHCAPDRIGLKKNFDFIPTRLYSYTYPGSLRASSRDVSRMEPGAAPAAAARNRGTGRPRVAVRPYYGGLPLMAGRGTDEGRRKLPGSGRGIPPVRARKHGPGTEIAAVERREARLRHHGGDAPRQACRAASPAVQEASQASAFLGAPLPQGGAGWKTAYPAPQRIRAAECWLFEI